MELANRTEPVSSPEAGGRAEVRSNIFVDATIASDDGCGQSGSATCPRWGAHRRPWRAVRRVASRLSRGDLKISGPSPGKVGIVLECASIPSFPFQSGCHAAAAVSSNGSTRLSTPSSRAHLDRQGPSPCGPFPVDLRAELGLESSLRRIAEDLRAISRCASCTSTTFS